MANFLENLTKNFSREKLVSFLLVFSFGIHSLQPKVINKPGQERKIPVKNIQISLKEKTESGKFFGKEGYLLEGNDTLLNLKPNLTNLKRGNLIKVKKKIKVIVTAYSSNFLECDGSPFRTASGSYVGNGIIAANFLPFGSKIKIPKLFGDKIFVVEDRMAKRFWYRVDIWMSSYEEAINFGKKYTEIEILD
ncbi:MAG: hypothetical protein COS98_00320 [Parcubacteria group bacterium CG07_land_8_20_14_0_80_35_11]|nr:MAG: hypothetical protein COS98_00320 [Parcubacteria group bacterium CG07_land_8_20_14_0_80_35_11]